MTVYVLAEAPKHSALVEHDCAFCGHPGLARPVWIRDSADGTPRAAGAGCAARLLYGRSDALTRRAVLQERDAHERALIGIRAEQEQWRRTAAAALLDIEMGLEGSLPVQSMRRAFHGRGGMAVLGPFPEWMESVLESGRL